MRKAVDDSPRGKYIGVSSHAPSVCSPTPLSCSPSEKIKFVLYLFFWFFFFNSSVFRLFIQSALIPQSLWETYDIKIVVWCEGDFWNGFLLPTESYVKEKKKGLDLQTNFSQSVEQECRKKNELLKFTPGKWLRFKFFFLHSCIRCKFAFAIFLPTFF